MSHPTLYVEVWRGLQAQSAQRAASFADDLGVTAAIHGREVDHGGGLECAGAGIDHRGQVVQQVVVGMQAAIEDGDQVITGYRDHGHMLACGMDPKGVMAELTGRSGGYSKGKGGSMHMFSREKNFFAA